jgi:hypothetical protein
MSIHLPNGRRLTMAYAFKNSKGTTYYLHGRTRTLKSGKKQTLYFFAKTEKEGTLDAVPVGYEVFESKNGLPVLKKK